MTAPRKCEKCNEIDAQPGERYCSPCMVSMWVLEMMAEDWILPCGHSYHAAVYGQDGTAHCGECKKEAEASIALDRNQTHSEGELSKCGHPVGAARDIDGHEICMMCWQGEA